MKNRKLLSLLGCMLLTSACGSHASDTPQARSTHEPVVAAAAPAWAVVDTPNVGSGDNVLAAIAGARPNDVWAVGQYAPGSDPNITLTLALHFDGSAWSIVTTPNEGAQANAFLAVTAQPGGAWAVGYHIGQDFLAHSLIEHWDGHAWHRTAAPRVHETENLYGVASTSTSDVWAVGSGRDDDGPFSTLALHFDGRSWSPVPTPNPGSTGNVLYGVVALAANDAWAVGQKIGDGGPDQALLEHWNGQKWSEVAGPQASAASTQLLAVSATGDDIRAVGDAQDGVQSLRTFAAVSERAIFSVQSTDNPSTGDNRLTGVVAVNDDDTWAVGGALDTTSGNVNTLIVRGGEHSNWARVASPNPSVDGSSQLSSVTRVGDDLWAAGAFDGPDAAQTLILQRAK